MLNRDARARRQAPPRATLRRSLGLRGRKCAGRRLDSTKEEGDWPSTGGEETDSTLPEREFCSSYQHRKLRGAFSFFRDGGEGEPVGMKCQREQVRRSVPSELRR